MKLKTLVGSGDKIMLFTSPFLIIGLVLNVMFPSFFSIGGPPVFLMLISIIFMVPGIIIWLWSVALILTKVPKNELISNGPYALVKHPIYTSVALLVLPWIGFLLDSWLGVLIGAIMYICSRMFSPAEEVSMASTFGAAWEKYRSEVKIPWL
jgi:protein-S-isoprenylcysteine O-methyltransferase Ste14